MDCKSFYASCHSVFNEASRNIPTVVLSNNDGCVIAACPKAKKFGFTLGTNFFEAKDELKRMGVRVFSSNFTFYGDMSERVGAGLKTFTPIVEPYSIDEWFLEFPDYRFQDLTYLGRKLQKSIFQWTRLPITFGSGRGKFIAKIASFYAKKYPEFNGVCHIKTQKQLDDALREIPCAEMWYIGPKSAQKLKKAGITNGAQFRDADTTWVKKTFTSVGWRLQRELRGIPSITLQLEPKQKKRIGHIRGFKKMVTKQNDLLAAIATFTSRAAHKMRGLGLSTRHLYVHIYTNPHREDLPQYNQVVGATLPVSTDSTIELTKYATKMMKRLYRQGYHYKRAGVELEHLEPTSSVQLNLFDTYDRTRDAHVMQIVDEINHDHGRDTIWFGSQDLFRRKDSRWHMGQEFLSPCPTTKWADIPRVRLS